MHRTSSLLTCLFLALLPALGHAAEPAPVTVKVVEKGERPRTRLRISPQVGSVQEAEIAMRMAMSMSMDGSAPLPVPMPTMVMNMRSTVDAVLPNGNIQQTFELTGTALRDGNPDDPATMATIEAELAKLVGMTMRSERTATGATVSSSTELPAGADPGMKDQLDRSLSQATAPLPDGPVGVGAQWQVELLVRDQGLDLTQTTTYTLTSLSGTQVALDVSVAQHAEPQIMAMAGMPPGTQAELVSLDSSGAGVFQQDLTQLLPSSSLLDLSLAMAVRIGMEGQAMDMGMDMEMTMTLTAH